MGVPIAPPPAWPPAAVLDYLVAVTMATEVPPKATGAFTAAQIPVALAAVAGVILQRAQSPLFGDTPLDVVLEPKQFSAVCREDYWRKAMAGNWFPSHVRAALDIWQRVSSGALASPVPGAMWYYSPISMVPPFRVPGWVTGKREVMLIGVHRDYFRWYAQGG